MPMIRGLETRHEQSPQKLLRDTRTMGQRVGDFFKNPIAIAITLVSLGVGCFFFPGFSDVFFLSAVGMFFYTYTRKHTLPFRLPDGSPGLSYQSKYAVIGGDMGGPKVVADGLNEMGLSAGTFYFPGFAGYAKINASNAQKALSPLEFPHWLLTQFANVDEVKKEIHNVVIAPTLFKDWGIVPPFHYVVYDKQGKCIVIEPIDGELVVYDNPLGVITNSPTFDWHMTNLRNYMNLSPVNIPEIDMNGVILQQLGQGNGLCGLPGDFTPPSRFVRAAIFSTTALPSKNANDAVLQTFHILNQFDIPLGAVRAIENGVAYMDYTMITTVKDPENLNYYFRTYDNQNISVVKFKAFDLNAKNIKMIDTTAPQIITDVSSTAK